MKKKKNWLISLGIVLIITGFYYGQYRGPKVENTSKKYTNGIENHIKKSSQNNDSIKSDSIQYANDTLNKSQ